jgi:hypothetical protein
MTLDNLPPYWPALAIGGLLLLCGLAVGLYFLMKKSPTPAELERQRRESLDASGKMGDGTVTEIQQNLISYSYIVRGIEYQASQDCTALESLLPEDRWTVVGAVNIKYDARNPANSIVLSERWSGLRKAAPKFKEQS